MGGKKLVIVESPAKARTVGRFLGSGYEVRASVGHVRDLPANRLGVDVEQDFAPRYVVPTKKKEIVKQLKEQAKGASSIYLATDPDREGEAISWHLLAALNVKDTPVQRVEFHEITKDAIADAFAHPREINQDLVNAQQARRVLDRLVGYNLSPLLRRKMSKKGLSAGRVQSVAVRLVVEREREIQQFTPREYWTLEAELAKRPLRGTRAPRFKAKLRSVRGEKAELNNQEETDSVLAELQGARYVVTELRKRDTQRNPAPPFTTSTLQQEASRKLGFTAKRTMAVAQQLYEGLPIESEGSVGLITYMRTDSTNLAVSALEETREYIRGRYGPEYVPASPRVYKSRAKGAQEAHEAVRPTATRREPEVLRSRLTSDQYRLYKLIWQRMVACQMASAQIETTTVDVGAGLSLDDHTHIFRATGSVIRFPGFTTVYTEGHDEGDTSEDETGPRLPVLKEGEEVDLIQLLPEQHFTQPPPRYTEATLVKALEEHGIGRPSTYAPTLSTIQDRGYIERTGKQLTPTELGFIVNDLLVKHFPDVVDVSFTAGMEEELDEVARGERAWVGVLRDFYGPFAEDLNKAEHQMESVEIKPEPAGIDCDVCGRPMVIKRGRFGRFIACSGYPECRNSKPLVTPTGAKCPECGGEIVERRTRRGRIFYGCSNYPNCHFATWKRPVPEPCPVCGGLMVADERKGNTCTACGHVEGTEEPKAAARG
ncbi:MAG: type I DNA topoisomerase [Chloroflexota bacterium]